MKNPLHYFFLRDKRRAPVALILSAVNHESGALQVGYSTWNPADKFNKAEALYQAAKVLPLGPMFPLSMLDGKNTKAVVLECLAGDTTLPGRLRHAAKLWLKMHKGIAGSSGAGACCLPPPPPLPELTAEDLAVAEDLAGYAQINRLSTWGVDDGREVMD